MPLRGVAPFTLHNYSVVSKERRNHFGQEYVRVSHFRDMTVLWFFGMYPAMGVALYRRGVMDNLAR